MTALNWELNEDGVVILSDTLVLSGETHRPLSFTTKVFPLPHLSLCIAGTGLQQMVQNFWLVTNNGMVVSDIDHLDRFATETLQGLWDDLDENAPRGVTATIYTFGWSLKRECFIGFAYRSTNGFASQPLAYGLALKPAPSSGEFPKIDSLSDLANYMIAQKEDDRSMPRMERVGIGGEIILTQLFRDQSGYVSFQQIPILRFDDFEDDWKMILASLPKNAGHPIAQEILAKDP
jgi:hypothetical protein